MSHFFHFYVIFFIHRVITLTVYNKKGAKFKLTKLHWTVFNRKETALQQPLLHCSHWHFPSCSSPTPSLVMCHDQFRHVWRPSCSKVCKSFPYICFNSPADTVKLFQSPGVHYTTNTAPPGHRLSWYELGLKWLAAPAGIIRCVVSFRWRVLKLPTISVCPCSLEITVNISNITVHHWRNITVHHSLHFRTFPLNDRAVTIISDIWINLMTSASWIWGLSRFFIIFLHECREFGLLIPV